MNVTFFYTVGAAKAEAGTTVRISFQSGSCIHVKGTDVNAKTPSAGIIVTCRDFGIADHGHLAIIAAKTIIVVFGYHDFGRNHRQVNRVDHQTSVAAASGAHIRVDELNLTIGSSIL